MMTKQAATLEVEISQSIVDGEIVEKRFAHLRIPAHDAERVLVQAIGSTKIVPYTVDVVPPDFDFVFPLIEDGEVLVRAFKVHRQGEVSEDGTESVEGHEVLFSGTI